MFVTYARRVPSTDGIDTSNVGEVADLALSLPAVLGDEAVGAVGARDGGQGAGAVVVAGVVGDADGLGGGGQGEDGEDVGELHVCGWGFEGRY